MNQITILCCYNRQDEFHDFIEDLKKQTISTDVIGIDNTKGIYKSCAEAFNSNIEKVQTEYVIFSHQDILLPHENMLEIFMNALKNIKPYDILGVAGRSKKDNNVITNIRHGEEKSYAGKNRLTGIVECDTIDECFFGGTTKCFKKYPFDQKLCDNWHLYAVERSLAAIVRGNKVYVCGIPLIHKSKGKMNEIYNKQFYEISKKYSKNIGFLQTTCAYASTKFPKREVAYIKRKISLFLGRY